MKQPVNKVVLGKMNKTTYEVGLEREGVSFPICRGRTKLGAIRMSMRRLMKYHRRLEELEAKEMGKTKIVVGGW